MGDGIRVREGREEGGGEGSVGRAERRFEAEAGGRDVDVALVASRLAVRVALIDQAVFARVRHVQRVVSAVQVRCGA